MSGKIAGLLTLLTLAFVLLFTMPLLASENADDDPYVVYLRGQVSVMRSGGLTQTAVYRGMNLHGGDVIVTGPNSSVTIAGYRKEMVLGENTKIAINDMWNRHERDFSSVSLVEGTIKNRVDLELDENSTNVMRTSNMIVGIRGTEYVLIYSRMGWEDYGEENPYSRLRVIEGEVRLDLPGADGVESYLVTADEVRGFTEDIQGDRLYYGVDRELIVPLEEISRDILTDIRNGSRGGRDQDEIEKILTVDPEPGGEIPPRPDPEDGIIPDSEASDILPSLPKPTPQASSEPGRGRTPAPMPAPTRVPLPLPTRAPAPVPPPVDIPEPDPSAKPVTSTAPASTPAPSGRPASDADQSDDSDRTDDSSGSEPVRPPGLKPDAIAFGGSQNENRVYGDGSYTKLLSRPGSGRGSITYTSSNPAVGSINAVTGQVTILQAGTTIITARKGSDGIYSAVSTSYVLTVDRRELMPSIDWSGVQGKVYDGTAAITGQQPVLLLAGQVNGELPQASVSFAFTDKNAGINKEIIGTNLSLNGPWGTNYRLATDQITVRSNVSITRKPVTIGGVTASGRLYDGTRSVVLSGGVLDGVESSDGVGFTLSAGTMSDGNAGADKTVATNIVLTGTDAENYSLTQPSLQVTISKRWLTPSIDWSEVQEKVYDGTAAIEGPQPAILLTGQVNGESPRVSASFAFADKNVGTQKEVIGTNLSLNSPWGINYQLTTDSIAAGSNISITPKPITIEGVTAAGRTYDGLRSAALSGGSLNGVESNDSVGFTLNSGTMSDGNAGIDKTVTTDIQLQGADAGNYALTQPTVQVTIGKRLLTPSIDWSGLLQEKVYDGTGAIEGPQPEIVLTGQVDGESPQVSASFAFADLNVGTEKEIVGTDLSLSGQWGVNYQLAADTVRVGSNVSITPRPVSLVLGTPDAFSPLSDVALTITVSGYADSSHLAAAPAVSLGTIQSNNDYQDGAISYTVTIPATGVIPTEVSINYSVLSANYVYTGGTQRVSLLGISYEEDGTEESPISVDQSTIEEFNIYVNSGFGWNKHYLLTGDLDLSGVSWTPIGPTNGARFGGTFNGGGHTVYNLQLGAEHTQAGMFGYVGQEGMVTDLHMAALDIQGGQRSGSVAAWNYGIVQNCSAAGSLEGGYDAGGIIGVNFGTVKNCYSETDVFSSNNSGGVVGWHRAGAVSYCYATGEISGGNYAGGIVAHVQGGDPGSLQNCVALNPAVTAGAGSLAGRVAGTRSGIITMGNNFARADMGGSTEGFSEKTESSKNGEDIGTLEWNDLDWWEGMGFTDSWWDGKLPPSVPEVLSAPATMSSVLTDIQNCSVTVLAGEGGQISLDGVLWSAELYAELPVGTEVVMMAEPEEGYVFAGWQDTDGVLVGAEIGYSLVLESDVVLSAVFEPIEETQDNQGDDETDEEQDTDLTDEEEDQEDGQSDDEQEDADQSDDEQEDADQSDDGQEDADQPDSGQEGADQPNDGQEEVGHSEKDGSEDSTAAVEPEADPEDPGDEKGRADRPDALLPRVANIKEDESDME